ncbi:hypothetical protein F5Y08DRAFT_348400 [Xylaria arbuscula]|nr:hypothetical protein F5Y08DRAFT_348400 [Xylaria arbuscula]
MQYIVLSALVLAARVAHATPVNTNGTGVQPSNATEHVTLVEGPAFSLHPMPWPPGVPEDLTSRISVPARPTPPPAPAPAAVCPGEPGEPAGEQQPHPNKPAEGGNGFGFPHFEEPHAPEQHQPPHIGPGVLPVPIPVNGASSHANSMAALALGIAAAVFFSL